MSLLDDVRASRAREGITASTREHRLVGLYGESWWDHEPLRHPEAIKAQREERQAAMEKADRDHAEADRLAAILAAGGAIPDTYAYKEAAE